MSTYLPETLRQACRDLSDRVQATVGKNKPPEDWEIYFAGRPGGVDLVKKGDVWIATAYTTPMKDEFAAGNAMLVPDAAAATTAALPANTATATTLTADANGAFPAIDGQAVPLGGIVVVQDEATAANNGFYWLSTAGGAGAPWVLTRLSAKLVNGLAAYVKAGTVNGGKVARITTANPIVAGTTALTLADMTANTAVEALFEVASDLITGLTLKALP